MKAGRKLSYALVLAVVAGGTAAWGMDSVNHQPIAALRTALKANGQTRIAQGMQDILALDGTGNYVPAGSPLMLTTNSATHEWTVSVLDDKTEGSTVLIGTDLEKVSSDEIPSLSTFDPDKAKESLAAMNASNAGYYPDKIQQLAKEDGCKRVFTGKVGFVLKSALPMAWASRRYKLDHEIMKLKIDGEDIEIARGELSALMKKRVKELEAREAQIRDSSNDPAQIAQINAQLQKYSDADKEAEAKDRPPDFKNITPVFFDLWTAPNGNFHVLAVDQCGACVEVAAGNDFGDNK